MAEANEFFDEDGDIPDNDELVRPTPQCVIDMLGFDPADLEDDEDDDASIPRR